MAQRSATGVHGESARRFFGGSKLATDEGLLRRSSKPLRVSRISTGLSPPFFADELQFQQKGTP
jgi:hypothetical protein